jgi:hypothetical protein
VRLICLYIKDGIVAYVNGYVNWTRICYDFDGEINRVVDWTAFVENILLLKAIGAKVQNETRTVSNVFRL